MSRPLRSLPTRRVLGVTVMAVGAYVCVQITTGVVVGVAAAALVLLKDWTLGVALATTIPLGLPLAAAQGALLAALGVHVSRRLPEVDAT